MLFLLIEVTMSSPNFLIFGGPNSGKTHYAGQLVGRLKHKPNDFKIRIGDGASSDIAALTQVLTKLEEGNSADHTPIDQYSKIYLPLVSKAGQHIDLNWPDYGGEQISEIFKQREVPIDWQNRIESSDGWILFIRLSSETTYPDALKKLTSVQSKNNAQKEKRPDIWDANAHYIELIQILCHVGGIHLNSNPNKPPLVIALSCYDEINVEDKTPDEVFCEKLPLFSKFINNVWPQNKISIWGVSALGKSLSAESNDEDFIDCGPENNGWVIAPKQHCKDSDLAAPLSWLLDRI